MNIKSVIDNYKAKKLPDEKAENLLIKNQGLKSDIFFTINSVLMSIIGIPLFYILIINAGEKQKFVAILVSILLNISTVGTLAFFSDKSGLIVSKIMPSNFFLKLLPKKLRSIINKSITNEIVMDSIMPIESLKELSGLVDKKEFDEFLRIADGEPTYKKMSEFFDNIEKEKVKEEKISLLSDRLYDKLAISENKE